MLNQRIWISSAVITEIDVATSRNGITTREEVTTVSSSLLLACALTAVTLESASRVAEDNLFILKSLMAYKVNGD